MWISFGALTGAVGRAKCCKRDGAQTARSARPVFPCGAQNGALGALDCPKFGACRTPRYGALQGTRRGEPGKALP